MDDKTHESYQSFIDNVKSLSKEELEAVANAIQKKSSENSHNLYQFADDFKNLSKEELEALANAMPKKPSKVSPEFYQSFKDVLENASIEELEVLDYEIQEKIKDKQVRDSISEFAQNFKNGSQNIDTFSEEVRKR